MEFRYLECTTSQSAEGPQSPDHPGCCSHSIPNTSPTQVILGYTRYDVRTFVPLPRRCFNCQLFGHSNKKCRRRAVCQHCGEAAHNPCPNPASCVNCGGPHPASYNHCPIYRFEKLTLEIQASERLTIQSARQRARGLPGRDGRSFAEVLRDSAAPRRATAMDPSPWSQPPHYSNSREPVPGILRPSQPPHSVSSVVSTSNRFAGLALDERESNHSEPVVSPISSGNTKRPGSPRSSQHQSKRGRGGASRVGASYPRATPSQTRVPHSGASLVPSKTQELVPSPPLRSGSPHINQPSVQPTIESRASLSVVPARFTFTSRCPPSLLPHFEGALGSQTEVPPVEDQAPAHETVVSMTAAEADKRAAPTVGDSRDESPTPDPQGAGREGGETHHLPATNPDIGLSLTLAPSPVPLSPTYTDVPCSSDSNESDIVPSSPRSREGLHIPDHSTP